MVWTNLFRRVLKRGFKARPSHHKGGGSVNRVVESAVSEGNSKEEQVVDENEQIALRRTKLGEWRESDAIAFPNGFERDAEAGDLQAKYEDQDKETLEANPVKVTVAGRMMSRRIMGKASFTHIQDGTGRLQLYVTRDALPEGFYNETFKGWDVGDIVGATGTLFRTNKGELSVNVEQIQLLTKSLRPLPEKYHGLTDAETRYRQRYVDLIMNEDVRDTFRTRSQIVAYIRNFMGGKDYLEVETPMMQVIPGGAVARPFVTHHNALDMEFYLRIAPELYLKRLVVGGFERVFEINRNFRNEGVSTKHNPEFTMMEFYGAYQTYVDYMDLTEEMFRGIAENVLGSTVVPVGDDASIDLGKPFVRMTMHEAVAEKNPSMSAEDLNDPAKLAARLKELHVDVKDIWGPGKMLFELFEATVEDHLFEPTFITQHPTEVSPLSRANDEDPSVTDRFELFIGGREIANGFSELNDPEDQAARFHAQVAEKDAGDDEAMHFDADYIRALEYGMPPTAGEGIGIDRLVMLMTNSPSIRDVLLFPHMRPEV